MLFFVSLVSRALFIFSVDPHAAMNASAADTAIL